ncbi:unnamed protein product, partial [Acanthoscelides obtectus]
HSQYPHQCLKIFKIDFQYQNQDKRREGNAQRFASESWYFPNGLPSYDIYCKLKVKGPTFVQLSVGNRKPSEHFSVFLVSLLQAFIKGSPHQAIQRAPNARGRNITNTF